MRQAKKVVAGQEYAIAGFLSDDKNGVVLPTICPSTVHP